MGPTVNVVAPGTTTTVLSANGMTLSLVCTASDVTLQVAPSTTGDPLVNVFADSSKGGHVETTSSAPSSPATIEHLAVNVFDRGNFDVFNNGAHALNGSYVIFASGTGCEYDASALTG